MRSWFQFLLIFSLVVLVGFIIVLRKRNPDVHVHETGSLCEPSTISNNYRGPPFNLDPHYEKICVIEGIPTVSSSKVDDQALIQSAKIMKVMLSSLDSSVLQKFVDAKIRVAIMDETEVTSDIPEHSDLNQAFPNADWDIYRGLGATLERPVSSGAEENLLCNLKDIYSGEDIFVHEFAHTIHKIGLSRVYPDFELRLFNTFNNAKIKGIWKNTYAESNPDEYWAEGVQSWFDVNQLAQEGIHNHINSRDKLKKFDPMLYDLIATYFPDTDLHSCHKN